MTQSLYRIHGTWDQAFATLAANGLPGLEEGMMWLDLDTHGELRRVTKARDIIAALDRGTFVRVDIYQIENLVGHLNDGDPNAKPDPIPPTVVNLGPHLNLQFSNEDFHLERRKDLDLKTGPIRLSKKENTFYANVDQMGFYTSSLKENIEEIDDIIAK